MRKPVIVSLLVHSKGGHERVDLVALNPPKKSCRAFSEMCAAMSQVAIAVLKDRDREFLHARKPSTSENHVSHPQNQNQGEAQ